MILVKMTVHSMSVEMEWSIDELMASKEQVMMKNSVMMAIPTIPMDVLSSVHILTVVMD